LINCSDRPIGGSGRPKRRIVCASPAAALAAIAAGVLLQGSVASAQVLEPSAFVAVSASVVRVEAGRDQGGLAVGSGVTVAPSIVVTNCHVTRNAATIRISGGGSLWEVTGQYADGAHDLCFLRAPTWHGRPAALGERESLQLGQPLAAIGFPEEPAGHSGSAGAGVAFARRGTVIESDTAFTSGASGGGLFDASGALVGLLTFRMRGSSGNYFSLPVRWIRDGLPAEGQWDDVHARLDALPFWQRDAASLLISCAPHRFPQKADGLN
jgi:S1-C subfamily serine protease